ncbi:BamA/TamA family outer membrane protein [Taibaiella koreensis]|uniref:hypothetical protein n=1 Tax=Taibaiella koreensis TaxID=1268548 RepID=UPI0013C2D19E|nr:hypothetical protein [Taibaiella koreensis]
MTPGIRHHLSSLCAALLIGTLLFPFGLKAQQAAVYNRFQYHHYKWKALHTTSFHLYFPAGYDSLASFASVQLPDIMAWVKQEMGVPLKNIPNLVIYPSIDQLYESNIGLSDQQQQTFPTIQLKGSRVLLAFDGAYDKFRQQLTEACVRLTWEEQMKGDVEEQLTNTKQQLPVWFRQGAICYFAQGWPGTAEAAFMALQQCDTAAGWEQLSTKEPALAGQAFCYFLQQRYREDAVRQVLFQLRQGKTLSRALRLVTKRRQDTLTQQCQAFYHNRFTSAGDNKDTLPAYLEQLYQARLQALAYSPDGSKVAYTLQQGNRRRVYVAERRLLAKDKEKPPAFTQYLMPPWLEDHSEDLYPLISWKKDGRGIYLLLPEKGKMKIMEYDAAGRYRDSRTLYGLDGAGTLSEWEHNRFLLSAWRRGRSDVVTFDAQRLRYSPLTAGIGDHNEATVLDGDLLVYRSGYPADSVYYRDTLARTYGLYYKTIAGGRTPDKTTDKRLRADSTYFTWHDPESQPDGRLALTHTRSGIPERDTLTLTQPEPSHTTAATPWLKDYLARQRAKDSIDALLRKLKAEDKPSVLRGILSPGSDPGQAGRQQDSIRRALAYTGKKVRPYVLQLYSAYFSAQINNDYYINRYQPFQAYLGTFKFPSVGAMAQGGFSDLFENHHFNIGYRLPAGSEGSDFFVRYENTARKLDWHILFFRKVESLEPDPGRDWKDNRGFPYPQAAKVKTHYYELGFHYPLHYDWSLDFTTAARRDRTVFLATDRYSLNFEALQSWWSISSLALQVRKLQPTIPFLYQGWEGKMLLDGMASTGKQSTLLYGLRGQLAWHRPLVKHITFVIQAQGGYSGGQSRILYNFGGLDNNIVPRVDTSVRFPQQSGYAFQSLVTPLRGYEQNSLYGSRFCLFNADLYVPLFRDLIPLKTGISAVYNLQLGLFADMAAAQQDKILPATKTPLYAYGFSARTLLAGYPLRFDMAWPGNFNRQPVWYLSMTIK